MEATLRPYDRGEEVTPFATLGLYHAYRALPSYAYPFVLSYLQGGSGSSQDCLALALYHGLEGGTGQEGSESSAMGLSCL